MVNIDFLGGGGVMLTCTKCQFICQHNKQFHMMCISLLQNKTRLLIAIIVGNLQESVGH